MIRKTVRLGDLLVSEGLRGNNVTLECKKCQHGSNQEWVVRLTRQQELPECPSCQSSGDAIRELESISVIDSLSALAEESNTGIEFISVDTEEGAQLMQGFGGLAAILRYPIM